MTGWGARRKGGWLTAAHSREAVRVPGQSRELGPGPPAAQQLQVHRRHVGGDPAQEALAEEPVALASRVDGQMQRAAAGQQTVEGLDALVGSNSNVPSSVGLDPLHEEDHRHGYRHEVWHQVHVCEPRRQHRSDAGRDGQPPGR